jgi:hypothetical protein
LDDLTFSRRLDFGGKSLGQAMAQLEQLLASDRPELIIYRPELEMKLARMKELYFNYDSAITIRRVQK